MRVRFAGSGLNPHAAASPPRRGGSEALNVVSYAVAPVAESRMVRTVWIAAVCRAYRKYRPAELNPRPAVEIESAKVRVGVAGLAAARLWSAMFCTVPDR
jgi:hypothetical protein